ncbi:hypothetical protein [Streptomyces violascens]|uniref:hypothetical protein n=1 Tax=Streptomyces violascens TaxID=67381 RepID=UPI0036951D73
MPKHGPRRAVVTFHEVAERQLALLSDADLERLDPLLVAISINPKIGETVPESPLLRDYQQGTARVIYYATALGTIIVVAYVEA